MLANKASQLIYENILAEISDSSLKDPVLVPIPISKARRRKRGHNQVELLCQAIKNYDIENNFLYEKNILIKVKDTPSQTGLKRKDRLENLDGAFAVKNSGKIFRRNILLVDDVTTTGTTLREAARTLKQAGAKRIIAFTLAH